MIDLRKLHPRYWSLRLVWDVFMVWVALANLGLIVFDLTYLPLRPLYHRYLPVVTRTYDPVKGVEAHPLTDELLREAGETARLLELDPGSPGLAERAGRLRRLSLRMLRENPFDRSGQTRTLEVFKALLGQEMGRPTLELETEGSLRTAVGEFWVEDPAVLGGRLDLFDERLRHLLEKNFFREIDVRGRLVDYFWLIDLPFLSLFIAEFVFRWALAIRRRLYARWFFFPIFNWYDLIGLIPYTQFRVFRLLRIASIYMRLRRSELSRVGKDVLSRGVAYVSNIIAEEISDAVALRILSETQEEIRDGTHKRIFDRTILARREEIESVAARQIRRIVASQSVQERIRGLVRMNLESAAESSDALRSVPLPDAILRPLVRGIGEVLLGATLQAVTATLESAEGQRAVRQLVGAVLDEVVTGPWRDEIDSLSREIGLDVIEHMKTAVSVKKWAAPDRDSTAADDGPREGDEAIGTGPGSDE